MVRRLAAVEVPADGVQLAGDLINAAVDRHASDVHLDPTRDGYAIRFRVDGVLGPSSTLSPADGRALVTRLMVLAQLLTYRLDLPQEGRLVHLTKTAEIECRLAVIPSVHGLRAALRLPGNVAQSLSLEEISLPSAAADALRGFAAADSGMLILCGPAGAGKTTTIYALLHYLTVTYPEVSVITLEDPIERLLPGVTQVQISQHGGMTYKQALRSVLRQDPQVLMLGEIRDAETASLAAEAALSGHRLICTLHAASCGSAIGRLMEMGLKPYQITSVLHGVLSQRLVRRKVDCDYRGRFPIAEFAALSSPLRAAVLANEDAESLDRIVRRQSNHVSLRQSGELSVEQGLTDQAELLRTLGSTSEAAA